MLITMMTAILWRLSIASNVSTATLASKVQVLMMVRISGLIIQLLHYITQNVLGIIDIVFISHGIGFINDNCVFFLYFSCHLADNTFPFTSWIDHHFECSNQLCKYTTNFENAVALTNDICIFIAFKIIYTIILHLNGS